MSSISIVIVIGLVALGAIVTYFLLPVSNAEDIYFLTSTSNGNGTGCTDLDCLDDVSVINPLIRQLLVFNNNTQLWENENSNTVATYISSSTLDYQNNFAVCDAVLFSPIVLTLPPITSNDIGNTITVINLNDATPPFCSVSTSVGDVITPTGATTYFLSSSESVTFVAISSSIWQIQSTANGNTLVPASLTGVTLSPLPNGLSDYEEFKVRNLLSGTGITLVANTTHILITNSLPESTVCNNLGSGNQLCSGGNVNIDSLIAGSGISITDTIDDWTIANTAQDNTVCANVGSGSNVYKDGECNFRSILGSSDISVTQQTDTITIDFNGSSSSPQIGQEVGAVYLSLAKTNIGNAYVDIYVSAFDEENMMVIDCANVTYGRVTYIWDYVGTGTQQLRWVDVSNNANVFYESPTFTTDRDATDSGDFVKPTWCTGIVTIEWQGKSTTAGDDPVAKGYKITTK